MKPKRRVGTRNTPESAFGMCARRWAPSSQSRAFVRVIEEYERTGGHRQRAINVPISCGGTVVCPGDIVVGDSDGVTVVPRGDAEAVLKLVAELMARESKRIAEIKGGGLLKGEIDDTLRSTESVETATR